MAGSSYAPRTGFGDNYRTSAKFSVLHPDQMFPQWVSRPRLTQHVIHNSHKVITQYHGREPWRITMRLWFDSIEDLERLDQMVGRVATLRYLYGGTKTVGGYRETIEGAAYLNLNGTLLLALEDEQFDIGGHCEATATFERLYVDPPVYNEPVWPGAPRPIILPIPALWLSPLESMDEAGPVTPTLSGSARVVETDRLTAEYENGLPDGRNYDVDPYFANGSTYHLGGGSQTTTFEDGWAKCVATAAGVGVINSRNGTINCPASGEGDVWTFTATIRRERNTGFGLKIRRNAYAGPNGTSSQLNSSASGTLTITDSPEGERVSYTFPACPAGTQSVGFQVLREGGLLADDEYWTREWQVERGTEVTPFIDPRNDPHAWFVGTENASQSVRKKIVPKATNLSVNPNLAIDLNQWSVNGSSTAREELPSTVPQIFGISNGIHVTDNSANASFAHKLELSGSTAGIPIVASVFVYVPPEMDGRNFSFYSRESGGSASGGNGTVTTMALQGGWNRVSVNKVVQENDRTNFEIDVYANPRVNGDQYWATAGAFNFGLEATPYFDGDTSELTAWTGTPNASTSTRERTPSIPAWEVLEETTNLLLNPLTATNTNQIATFSTANISVGGEIPGMGKSTLRVETIASGSDYKGVNYKTANLGTGATTTYIGSVRIMGAGTLRVYTSIRYTDATEVLGSIKVITATSEPQDVVTHSVVSNPAKTIESVELQVRTDSNQLVMFWTTNAQVEAKAYATPFCPQLDPDTGNPLTGYAWTGTAHASSSTRTSGAIYTPIGANGERIDAQQGELMILAESLAKRSNTLLTRIGDYSATNGSMVEVGSGSGSVLQSRIRSIAGFNQGEQIPSAEWDVGDLLLVDFAWNQDTVESHNVINGEPRAEVSQPTPYALDNDFTTANRNFYLGTYSTSGSQNWHGLIYWYVVFARPLTDAERERAVGLLQSGELSWDSFGE